MKAVKNTFGVTFYLRRYKINQDGTKVNSILRGGYEENLSILFVAAKNL
ncbi:hypothetical protein ACQKCH_14505 [Nubsella zeaxanthinifaciens]